MTRDEVIPEVVGGDISKDPCDPWAMTYDDLVEALLTARTEMAAQKARADAAEAERDALRGRLAKLEKSAAESIARVEALTAEVEHREWVDGGAPMAGEVVLGCAHGRPVGSLCPHCAGVR